MYLASKRYKIVCKENCRHAQRIKKENLLTYSSVEEAEKDGCRKGKCCFKSGE